MSGISEKQTVKKVEKELMTSLIVSHLSDGNAIGLWRLPGMTKKNLIICTEGAQSIDELNLEELGTGFAFAPFDCAKKKIFLKANLSYSFDNGEAVDSGVMGQAYQANSISNSVKPKKSGKFFQKETTTQVDATHNAFVNLIKKSVQEITDGGYEKLVPSRCKQISLPPSFDLIKFFNHLCSIYPNAFISLVSSDQTGTWMGASPELLVSVDDQMKFRTAAVAGTQTVLSDTDLKQIAWTQKEIEEQALVSRYIINCFKKIRLREFEEHGPKTWRAGNLLHLRTEFEVDMTATNFPQLGSVMLKLLHPTSAVCGMPREESLSFLKVNENFDRDFYSGYLGPVNYQNQTHLFVNLRCMQWLGEKAVLFAGAGVTLDSNPEKEWEETEMKMDTLLRVIQS